MDRWRERHGPRLVRPVRLMCEVHVDLPVWVTLAPGEDDLRYLRGEHVNRGHALRRWAETELGLEVELVL